MKKGVFLKYFTKFPGKQLCQSLFSNKEKETLAQVLSCEFCTFFTEHIRAAASQKTLQVTLILTWDRLTDGLINGKYNLVLTPINKQMKFSLENRI